MYIPFLSFLLLFSATYSMEADKDMPSEVSTPMRPMRTSMLESTHAAKEFTPEKNVIWHASHNNLEEVKTLVSQGVSVHGQDTKGSTALHWASFKGHLTLVTFLLQSGAQINKKNYDGKTALQWACGKGHYAIARTLLNSKADPDLIDTRGDTPLHWALYNHKNELVPLLLEFGAEINCQNNEGISPLNTALIAGNGEMVKLLLQSGAYLLKDKRHRTPFHCALWGGSYRALKYVLKATPDSKRGAALNVPDAQGETPLHVAASKGDWESALLLISCGAHVNAKDFLKERTPLHVCLRNHEGAFIHAYTGFKEIERLTTQQVIRFINALKSAHDFDITGVDEKGFNVLEYVKRIKFKNTAEKDDLMDALFDTTFQPYAKR